MRILYTLRQTYRLFVMRFCVAVLPFAAALPTAFAQGGLPHPSTGKVLAPDRYDFAPGMAPDTLNQRYSRPGHAPDRQLPFPWVVSPRIPKSHVGFWNITKEGIKFRVIIAADHKIVELGPYEMITLNCGTCTSETSAEIVSPSGKRTISLAERNLAKIMFADSFWQFAKEE